MSSIEIVSYNPETRLITFKTGNNGDRTFSLNIPDDLSIESEMISWIQNQITNGTIDDITSDALSGYLDTNNSIELTDIQKLEIKSKSYINFGKNLYSKVKEKTWAINVLNQAQGVVLSQQDMLNLLNSGNILALTLSTGSLLTAKTVLQQLHQAYPTYTSVANYAITEINTFMGI